MSNCPCVTCHSHKDEAQVTFQKVATVIGIYKLASHWWEVVKKDPNASKAYKEARLHDLEDAEQMVQELSSGMEELSPASRQQLLILFEEMKRQGMSHMPSVSAPTLTCLEHLRRNCLKPPMMNCTPIHLPQRICQLRLWLATPEGNLSPMSSTHRQPLCPVLNYARAMLYHLPCLYAPLQFFFLLRRAFSASFYTSPSWYHCKLHSTCTSTLR